MHDDEYTILPVMEHYNVYHNGKFICSADNVVEAAKEIEIIRKEQCA